MAGGDFRGVFTSAAPWPREGTKRFLVLVPITLEASWVKWELAEI